MNKILFAFVSVSLFVFASFGQGTPAAPSNDEKALAVIANAVEKIGGSKYLSTVNLVGIGNFSQLRDGIADVPLSFVDVIVFPDKERTEFKQGGIKNIQTNVGDKGWVFDGAARLIKEQSQAEISNFRKGIRTSLDNILRGTWKKESAILKYVGKREAGLGKRNDVVKLIYPDGFEVEFEFGALDGMPAKSVYKRKNAEGEELKEEDRYALYVDVQGIKVPFVIDHFINGKHTSRINYKSLEFNKSVPDAIFNKPADIKELKKDLKL